MCMTVLNFFIEEFSVPDENDYGQVRIDLNLTSGIRNQLLLICKWSKMKMCTIFGRKKNMPV